MSVRDFQQSQILEFGGAMTALDAPDVPPPKGLYATNVQYPEGAVESRYGFGQVFVSNEPASSLYHWRSSLGSYLCWYNTQLTGATPGTAANSIRYIDLAAASPSAATLVSGSLSGVAAAFANAGSRLYCTAFNSAGRGATSVRVVSYSSGFVSDAAFQGPIAYTPSAPTEPLAGLVTAGLHKLAYRIEYRSGFVSRPSPDGGGAATPSPTTFAPISFTAAGSKNLSWTLNTTWPVGAIAIWIMMTPASNPNRWFMVPGARYTVTGGSSSSATATISISDGDLIATGEDCTASLLYWTYSANGATAPFNASYCYTHGDRMFYLTTVSDGLGNQISAAVVSDQNDYQAITQDQHVVFLPGNQDIITGCSLDGVSYLFGPNWTYSTEDNGAEPVTWAAPRLVDGRRGTLAPRGVEVSPSGTYAWVAHQTGLYYFAGGQYPAVPISHFQSEWGRINWSAAWCIEIKDNPDTKTVTVKVPLDGATTATHILAWQYDAGFTAGAVNFAVYDIPQYGIGGMEIVQNDRPSGAQGTAKRLELWVAPSMATNWLIDPSFNQSALWTTGALWSFSSDGNAHTGTVALKRTADGATASSDAIETGAEYGVYAGMAMTAEAWAKSSGANGTFTCAIYFYDAAGVYISAVASSGLSPTASYTMVRASGVAPTNAAWCRVVVACTSHTAGAWYVDDVALYSGSILRQMSPYDTNPYRDNGYAVVANYETSLFPTKDAAAQQVYQHNGTVMRVKGSGKVSLQVNGLDRRLSQDLAKTELDTVPGREYRRIYSLRNESVSYQVGLNLIPNGSFDANTVVWTTVGGWSIADNAASAKVGRRYALHSGISVGDTIAIVDSDRRVAVVPGEQYYWEAWGKATSADGRLTVGLRFYNSAGSVLSNAAFNLRNSSTWERMANIVTVPANAATMGFVITAINKSTGTWAVDGVLCCKLDSYYLLSSLKHLFSPYIGAR